MSQQTVGFIDYVAQGGDTFDSIALVAYNEERMASTIIAANPRPQRRADLRGRRGRADPDRRDRGNAGDPAAVEEVTP